MRALVLAAVLLGGCQILIGIDDPVGDECSPFDIDTCDLSDTCDVDLDDGGRLTCRLEGTVPVGDLCFAADDCAGALSCVNGVCRSFCPVFGQDCPDPLEGTCVIQWGLEGQVCDSACTPNDNLGCNPEEDCILATNDTGTPISVCVPQGYYGNVDAGEPCTFLSECKPGFACNDPEGTGGVCTELCNVAEGSCGSGTCTARFETIHDDIQLGFCL